MPPTESLQDDQIQNKAISPVLSTEVLSNEKPKRFFDIPDTVIHSFSTYMQVVLRMSSGTKHQEFEVKKVLENAKNMFRDGVKYNDDLWMQHVAASVREIVDFIDVPGEDFYKAQSSIPPYATDQGIKDSLDKIVSIRSYLSDIVHFVQGKRLGIMHGLYPDDGYGTMRKEKFFKEEDAHLEKVCIDFVYILNDIFVKYCVGVVSSQPVSQNP